MDPKINFLSLNVGMSSTLAGLSTLITTQNLDIVFLQEVKSSGEQIELLLGGWDLKQLLILMRSAQLHLELL